jgi:ribosomal protein S27E
LAGYSQLTEKALLSRSRSQKSTTIHNDPHSKIPTVAAISLRFLFTLPGSECMTTTVSSRRSSFGMKCVQCGDELLAPDWSEYRNEQQVHHVWRCWKCDCCFETFANIESIEDIETSDDIFPSLLVA